MLLFLFSLFNTYGNAYEIDCPIVHFGHSSPKIFGNVSQYVNISNIRCCGSSAYDLGDNSCCGLGMHAKIFDPKTTVCFGKDSPTYFLVDCLEPDFWCHLKLLINVYFKNDFYSENLTHTRSDPTNQR